MQIKTVPTFLPNKGIVLNSPEEFLKDQFSTDNSRNMEFYNNLLQSRLGLTKFDSTQLSGPVLLIQQFWKFNNTWSLMVCTTKDIYKYDFSNSRFDILTPVYTTGTITIHSGDPKVVHLTTGNFTTGGVGPGDYIMIGTGASHTGSTWYEIDTKDSDTQVTLKTNAATCTGSVYTARKIFAGESTNFWNAVTFTDKNLGEVWIATNGVDTPVYYTGSGTVSPLTGLATGYTTCRYLVTYKDMLFHLWTVEGSNQPQRVRWSAVADCCDYDDLDFQDFMDDGFWITGATKVADYIIMFRERDAYVGRFIGGTDTFAFEKSTTCGGVWSSNSIVPTQWGVFYYGPENKFHFWNLLRDTVISENIFPETINLDPTLEQYIYGWQVESKNQIRWFCGSTGEDYNNYIYVYDYQNEVSQIWTCGQEQALCSMGDYLMVTDLYVDDTVWGEYYLDEQEGYWDTREFLSGSPITIYGGYDGYIRKSDVGLTDDGTSFTRVFESVRQNFKMPDQKKRLFKQQFWLESSTTGDIIVKIRKDDDVDFELASNTISLIDAGRDILKKNITWNKYGQNFKTRLESTDHFALLGYLNFVAPKGKTF